MSKDLEKSKSRVDALDWFTSHPVVQIVLEMFYVTYGSSAIRDFSNVKDASMDRQLDETPLCSALLTPSQRPAYTFQSSHL